MIKMKSSGFYFCIAIFIFTSLPCESIFLIIPEDVSTGLAGIYGFTPRFLTGKDHRVGFGFRFGNHADYQVLYEFGPQIYTEPLQPLRVRSASASYRQRIVRRRPLIQFLLQAGFLKNVYEHNAIDEGYDEPR